MFQRHAGQMASFPATSVLGRLTLRQGEVVISNTIKGARLGWETRQIGPRGHNPLRNSHAQASLEINWSCAEEFPRGLCSMLISSSGEQYLDFLPQVEKCHGPAWGRSQVKAAVARYFWWLSEWTW